MDWLFYDQTFFLYTCSCSSWQCNNSDENASKENASLNFCIWYVPEILVECWMIWTTNRHPICWKNVIDFADFKEFVLGIWYPAPRIRLQMKLIDAVGLMLLFVKYISIVFLAAHYSYMFILAFLNKAIWLTTKETVPLCLKWPRLGIEVIHEPR